MPVGGVLRIETKCEVLPADPRDLAAAPSPWPCVTMIVSDTGTGIPAVIIDRVFEPFFTTKGPGKGTGLGLSTVYGIVNQSGGVISVESERNRGTRFSIRFPAVEAPAAVAAAPAVRPAVLYAGTETILLVEDEPGVRQLVQRVLSGRGYDILEARDVTHAARDRGGVRGSHSSPAERRGDARPERAGSREADRRRRAPRFACSTCRGSPVASAPSSARRAAGVNILHKPFTPESLARTVRDCLDDVTAGTLVMIAERPLLLVVDDETAVLSLIRRVGESQGFEVVTCTDGRRALQLAEARRPDLVMVDLRMPDVNGLEIVRALRAADAKAMVVLMTGFGSIDSAVEAVKLGAADYLTKPFDFQRLTDTFATRSGRDRAARPADGRRSRGRRAAGVCRDDRAQRADAGSVRPHQTSGSARAHGAHLRRDGHGQGARRAGAAPVRPAQGQALCRRSTARRWSRRSSNRSCSATCAARSPERPTTKRASSKRPTAARSSSTRSASCRSALQAKLLRVLESGEVQRVGSLQPVHTDVRVVCASNRDLGVEVAAGRFRSDLLYRLNVVQITLPSLRDRREDIPYLTAAFLREFGQRFGKPHLRPRVASRAAAGRGPMARQHPAAAQRSRTRVHARRWSGHHRTGHPVEPASLGDPQLIRRASETRARMSRIRRSRRSRGSTS